jgi:hypothetical protein
MSIEEYYNDLNLEDEWYAKLIKMCTEFFLEHKELTSFRIERPSTDPEHNKADKIMRFVFYMNKHCISKAFSYLDIVSVVDIFGCAGHIFQDMYMNLIKLSELDKEIEE